MVLLLFFLQIFLRFFGGLVFSRATVKEKEKNRIFADSNAYKHEH